MDNITHQEIIYENFKGAYNIDVRAKVLIYLTRKFIRNGILDIGAANGSLMNRIQKSGFTDVSGIDIVPKTQTVTKGNITEIPFGNNTFNTVFCTEVLEHLTDEQIHLGLTEIYRVLNTGGNLIITIPYKEDFEINMVSCPHCSERFHRWGHLQLFDEARISNLLESHGFNTIKVKPYALGAMSVLPLGRYFNFILKKLKYESNPITMVVVAKKK